MLQYHANDEIHCPKFLFVSFQITPRNNARKDFQTQTQTSQRMLKWDDSLKGKAEYWANELVLTCKNRNPPKGSGLVDYGQAIGEF